MSTIAEILLILTNKDPTWVPQRNEFDDYIFGDPDVDTGAKLPASVPNSIENNIIEIQNTINAIYFSYMQAVEWKRAGNHVERPDLWVVIRQRLEKLHKDYNSARDSLHRVWLPAARLALGEEAPDLARDSYTMWLLQAAHYYAELMKIIYLNSEYYINLMDQFRLNDIEVARQRTQREFDEWQAREREVQEFVDRANWRTQGFKTKKAYHEFWDADSAAARAQIDRLANLSLGVRGGKRKSKSKKRRVRKTLRQIRSRRQTRNIRRRKPIPYRKIRSRKTKN